MFAFFESFILQYCTNSCAENILGRKKTPTLSEIEERLAKLREVPVEEIRNPSLVSCFFFALPLSIFFLIRK